MADNTTLADLRNHLFDCIEGIKSGATSTEQADSDCNISKQIIDSAKVEVDALRVISKAENPNVTGDFIKSSNLLGTDKKKL